MKRGILSTFLAAGLLLAHGLWAAPTHQPPFFLHDGDTVVFYGDSITEQQMYGRDIETYVTTRFPKMHVRFINSGWSGDKVTGGGGGNIELRLKRDVLNYKPTVVTIFLGMNDGLYQSYDQATFQTYSQGLTHIVDELTRDLPGVRLTLLTPSFFDYDAKTRPAPPADPKQANFGNPAPDYNQTLLKYTAFVKALGAQRHIPVTDLEAPLADATMEGRKTDPKFALSGDGVHPNEVGHLLMAAAVLQTWHAPATVQDITITPGKPQTITGPLPWPVPNSARTAFTVSPLPGDLDIFRVHTAKPRHLKPGAASLYRLLVDGQPIATAPTGPDGTVSFDLTRYPALPQNIQAQTVLDLIQQRIDAWHTFWESRKTGVARRSDIPTEDELSKLRAEDTALDSERTQAHDAAQPQPHTFLLLTTPAP